MSWTRYTTLEPIRRMKEEGRELIGKAVVFTEKRDGENVSIWLGEMYEVHVSSHNMVEADENIINRFKATPEYVKAVELLNEERKYNKKWILYGELLKTVSPTRIEPRRKHTHWIMFDMRNQETGKYADYSYVYQMGYHFKIPVVGIIGEILVNSVEQLQVEVAGALKWCRRHRREGIVGKCYGEDIFFKEKIDLPKRPKINRPQPNAVKLPEMPPDRIQRAVEHAYDECVKNGWDWKDKGKAMPTLVKHINNEASEHCFEAPRNIYQIYLEAKV